MRTHPVPDSRGAKPTAGAPSRRRREKTRDELRFAILRVKNKGLKLSISAVATEAGVTPALLHNTYPDIAEEIRAQIGRATRQQRDAKAVELGKAREQLRSLRALLEEALADIAKLASINETLRDEVATLKVKGGGRVLVLPPRDRS